MIGLLRVHDVLVRMAGCLLVIGAVISPALACGPRVDVQYREDSPDVFKVAFVSGQKFELKSLDIDMTSATGGVYIDDIYDPATAKDNLAARVSKVEKAAVGGQTARLIFENFVVGRSLIYWMDLDDQSPAGGADYNHLTAGEIRGAKASAILRHSNGKLEKIEGTFGTDGKAVLAPRVCV